MWIRPLQSQKATRTLQKKLRECAAMAGKEGLPHIADFRWHLVTYVAALPLTLPPWYPETAPWILEAGTLRRASFLASFPVPSLLPGCATFGTPTSPPALLLLPSLTCSWAAPRWRELPHFFLFLTPLSAAGQLCWNPKDPSTKIRNKSTWPSRQIILFLFSLEGGSDFVGFVWVCVFWFLLLTWNKGLRSRLASSPRHPDRQLILEKCQVQT